MGCKDVVTTSYLSSEAVSVISDISFKNVLVTNLGYGG